MNGENEVDLNVDPIHERLIQEGRIVINGPSNIRANILDLDLLMKILSKGSMLVRVVCSRLGVSESYRHQKADTDIYVVIQNRSDLLH